jgi:hypothetical protein
MQEKFNKEKEKRKNDNESQKRETEQLRQDLKKKIKKLAVDSPSKPDQSTISFLAEQIN